MAISINSLQIGVSSKALSTEKADSSSSVKPDVKSTSLGAGETVSISASAKALYSQSSAAERQASMSQSDLRGLYDKSSRDISKFTQVIAGGDYSKENFLPQTEDPDRLALGQKALDYSIARAQLPPKNASNPFAGMARDDLSAIVYDDTETYTLAERNAAYNELFRQDQEYFSKLFAKITNGGDNREVFKGILDYFDDLPPVEQSAYPDGFRDNIDSLYQEQLDQWGPLALIKQSAEQDTEKTSESIFTQGQSSAEMLQAILEKAIALSKA